MGNFLVFKAALHPSFSSYAGLRLNHIDRHVRARFWRLHREGRNNAAATAASSNSNRNQAQANTYAGAASSHAATATAASHSASTSSLPRLGSPAGGVSSSSSASGLARSSSTRALALGSYGFELDFTCFHLLFPSLSVAEAVAQFRAWDPTGSGVVDALELIAGLITLSEASFAAKLRSLFSLFDFDDSGGLSLAELTAMVSAVSAAWAKMFSTERSKPRQQDEVNELAKRAFAHLAVALPKPRLGMKRGGTGGRGGGMGAGSCETGAAKPLLRSPPLPYVAVGGAGEVPLDKLTLFAGVVSVARENLCRHSTTDADEVRAHWVFLVAQATGAPHGPTPASVDKARGEHDPQLLVQEVARIRGMFHNWLPYHRQLALYHAAQRQAAAAPITLQAAQERRLSMIVSGDAGGVTVPSLPGTPDVGATTSSLLSPPSPGGGAAAMLPGGAPPGSPGTRSRLSGGLGALGIGPGGLASPVPGPGSPLLQQFLNMDLGDGVQSKLTSPTASSLAKDKRIEGVHHDIKTTLWRPGSSAGGNANSPMLGPMSPVGGAGAGAPSHHSHHAAAEESKQQQPGSSSSPHHSRSKSGGGSKLDASLRGLEVSRSGGGALTGEAAAADERRRRLSVLPGAVGVPLASSGGFDDEDLRHRPAYLAIKRIKSKVSSRRSKNDPALAHYTYDKKTLQQAKAMFDSIDRDGSGEGTIGHVAQHTACSSPIWFDGADLLVCPSLCLSGSVLWWWQ
jgi:hypothetical protein